MRIETPFIFIWKGNDEEADRICEDDYGELPYVVQSSSLPFYWTKEIYCLTRIKSKKLGHITEFLE